MFWGWVGKICNNEWGNVVAPDTTHARFVESLERHAADGENVSRAAWSNMATELGWTVEHVQAYAYQYMMALNSPDENRAEGQANNVQVRMNGSHDVSMSNNHHNENTTTNGNTEWTVEEDILFDSLLAVYLPGDSSDNSSNRNRLDWEEQVASRLPGRTPMQVRQRYNRIVWTTQYIDDSESVHCNCLERLCRRPNMIDSNVGNLWTSDDRVIARE